MCNKALLSLTVVLSISIGIFIGILARKAKPKEEIPIRVRYEISYVLDDKKYNCEVICYEKGDQVQGVQTLYPSVEDTTGFKLISFSYVKRL